MGTAVGLLLRLFRKIFAVHRQRTATHTVYSPQAQHTRVAQFVSLEVTDSTYESIYLAIFILAGAVYNNALKNRAALLCRACLDEITCVAVWYLTLRTGCERHAAVTRLPFPCFAAVTYRKSAPDPQGKGVIHKRVETAGVYPLVPPPGRRTPLLRFSEKLPAR